MKVFESPEVYVIGRSVPDLEAVRRYLSARGLSWEAQGSPVEKLIEFAGRVCYRSFRPEASKTRPTPAYIANLLAQGHESVLEHAVFTLLIAGVSRALTHELVRHRHLSFSQESQRYVVPDGWVVPPGLLPALLTDFAGAVEAAFATYRRLASPYLERPRPERKRGLEAARGLLPNAAATTLVVTGNLRAWRHFVRLRATPEADAEIRRLAVKVFELLSAEAPYCWQDMELYTAGDGRPAVRIKSAK